MDGEWINGANGYNLLLAYVLEQRTFVMSKGRGNQGGPWNRILEVKDKVLLLGTVLCLALL